jgi:hypothetical protein
LLWCGVVCYVYEHPNRFWGLSGKVPLGMLPECLVGPWLVNTVVKAVHVLFSKGVRMVKYWSKIG